MNQEAVLALLFPAAVVTFVIWLARLQRKPFGPNVFLVNKFAGTVRLSGNQWFSESEPCLASFAIMALLPSAQFVQSKQEADTLLSVVWRKEEVGCYGRDRRYTAYRIDCSISVRDRRSRVKPAVRRLFQGTRPPERIVAYGHEPFSATGGAPVEPVSSFIRAISIEAP
jgi:hypothetical protein